jgi:Skp family chaperone for outer membrane proteins
MRYNYWTKLAMGALLLVSASGILVWAQGGAAGSAATPAVKIGLLNVRGAIVATAEGKQASAQMQSKFAPQQTELQNLQKQIQDLQTRLATGARTLSDEEKARLQRQGQYLVSQSQRKQDDLNEAVNLEQTDIFESIGGKMSDVVDKYGRDHNYSLILDTSAQGSPVVFSATDLDITQEIVRLYDQAHPLKAGAAAAAPAPAPPGQSARPAAQPGK